MTPHAAEQPGSFRRKLLGMWLLAMFSLAPHVRADEFAYVANFRSKSVSVIDTADNALVGTVVFQQAPTGIAAHPDGTVFYVVNGSVVSCVDAATLQVSDSVPSATVPHMRSWDIAISPDGALLYVANTIRVDTRLDVVPGRTLSIIDTGSLEIVTTILTDPMPFDVALHPSAPVAYLTHSYLPKLVVLDLDNNVVSASLPIAAPGERAAATSDGKFVWVANRLARGVSAIETGTGAVTKFVDLGPNSQPFGVAMAPDDTQVYVTNRAFPGSLFVIDTADGTVVRSVATGDAPRAVAVTSDGTRAYVANSASHSVSVIQTDTGAELATIAVGFEPVAIALGPRRSAVCTGDCDQSGAVRIDELVLGINIALGNATVDECPAFDPDGSGMVVISDLILAVDNALNGCIPVRSD